MRRREEEDDGVRWRRGTRVSGPFDENWTGRVHLGLGWVPGNRLGRPKLS